MGSKSDYLENKVLDLIFGATSYSAPGTIYVALFTVTPSDSGGGTEVSGGSYARKSVTNNTTNFPNASSGSKTTGADITFATPSADWGAVVAFGLFDASTSGNLLYWGAISPTKTINNGDTVTITTGSLTLTED